MHPTHSLRHRWTDLSCAAPEPTRRQLLRSGLAGLTAGSLGFAASAAQHPPPALVVVMLRGAVDGLSVVIPHGDPEYRRLRAEIAIAAPGSADTAALELDSQFGLHPSLARLMPWWRAGHLGFVHASGSPDTTRSHFDAQDYMETATPGRRSTPDGWLNRLLARSPDTGIRGMNLGSGMPRILSGAAAVGALPVGPAAMASGRPLPGQISGSGLHFQQALESLHATDPASQSAWRALQESREALQRSDESMRTESMGAGRSPQALPTENSPGMDPGIAPGAVPIAGLPRDAQRLGHVLRTQARLQVGFLSVGGWDTHVNQGGARGALANRLRSLADGLDALAHGLGPRLEHTVVLVMSEFGRTARQNGTQGTDHGHGNVMWLLGGPVRGGRVHGAWPGLQTPDLHEGRDLAITTDFRQVLAQVLARHMRLRDADLNTVLPEGAGRMVDLNLLQS
jgi:uncharacterized protein (DUF1501 family)